MAKNNGNITDWLDRLEAVIEKRDQQYAERQQQFESRQQQLEKNHLQFEKRQQQFEKNHLQFEKRQQQFEKNQQQFEKRQQQFEKRQQEYQESARLSDKRLEEKFARLIESQNLIYDLQAENERRFEENERLRAQDKQEQIARSAELEAALRELALAQAITQNNLSSLLEAFNDHLHDPHAHQQQNGKNGSGSKKNPRNR